MTFPPIQPDHLQNAAADRGAAGAAGTSRGGRPLRLMLTYGGWRDGSFADQLPRLLEPAGIQCLRASTGREVRSLIEEGDVHIAVLDLTIPMEPGRSEPAGPRVLQLLRRCPSRPPTIVVRPRQGSVRANARGLAEALREGAFTVLDDPVGIEAMLETLRRLVRRHYPDHWTAA